MRSYAKKTKRSGQKGGEERNEKKEGRQEKIFGVVTHVCNPDF